MSGIRISPRKIDQDQEKSIIIQAITDEAFCRAILPIAKPEYFDINYAKRVFIWVKRYYEQYECPPQRYIQDIFNSERKNLSPEDAELIGDFISSLSDKYAEGGEKKNSKYYIDEATKYLKKQSYIRLSEGLASYAKLGQLDECERELIDHKRVDVSTCLAINLHDEKVARSVLHNAQANKLFRMPGALGELLQDFETSRVYTILAKSGIGKSWFLTELALCASMNRLKVLMANWEMSHDQISLRYYKRLTGLGDEASVWNYPIIDCRKSQYGLCSEKSNKTALINAVGEIPTFEEAPKGYEPCSKCRDKSNFESAVWYEKIFREALSEDKVVNTLNGTSMMFGENIRSISFPKFSATISDLEQQILSLHHRDGFFPSVITIDYDSLVLPERFYSDQRHNSDEVAKAVGRLAHKYGLCIFIASQVNREGAKMKSATSLQIGDDWRKVQHTDGLIILNQSDLEKQHKIIRIGVGKMRDGDWNAQREVMVIQNLGTGQSLVDSEFISRKEE